MGTLRMQVQLDPALYPEDGGLVVWDRAQAHGGPPKDVFEVKRAGSTPCTAKVSAWLCQGARLQRRTVCTHPFPFDMSELAYIGSTPCLAKVSAWLCQGTRLQRRTVCTPPFPFDMSELAYVGSTPCSQEVRPPGQL